MSRPIPYLSDEAIERDAAALLHEYASARDVSIQPPIPIEDIVEKHLKLGIEFDDTHQLFGVPRQAPDPDILGAIFFDDRRIVIDESLDPEENPTKEGRYRFTLGHEGGGHWRLHRHLFAKDRAQATMFGRPAPSFICRSSEAKKREEWQADFYSSCLLMPRKLVFAAWDTAFPDRKPRVLKPRTPIGHPYVEFSRLDLRIGDLDCSENDDEALDRIAKPFAEIFLVSPIAMRIRLEKLGLLHRAVPRQRVLSGM
jgi:hypothetical protein